MLKQSLSLILGFSLFTQSVFAAQFRCLDLVQNSREGISAELLTVKTWFSGEKQVLKVTTKEGRIAQTDDVIDRTSEILFGWEYLEKDARRFVVIVGDRKISVMTFNHLGLSRDGNKAPGSLKVDWDTNIRKGFYMAAKFDPTAIQKGKTIIDGLQAMNLARLQTGARYTDAQMAADVEAFFGNFFLRDLSSEQTVKYKNGQELHPVVVGDLSEREINSDIGNFKQSLTEQNRQMLSGANSLLGLGLTIGFVVVAFSMLSSCMHELERSGLFMF